MKCTSHAIIAIAFAAALGITGCGLFAYGQIQPEIRTANGIAGLVEQDENVSAADLGISKPLILPTNALYVFKDLSRRLRTLLTGNSLKKAELTLRFADEGLIEIQSVSAKTKDPNILKPVLEHYQREISRLRKRAGGVRPDSVQAVNDFLTRLVDYQLYHYKFLGRLEKDIPPEAFGALKHAKEEVIETIMGVPLEFESPESFRKRLEAVMEDQNGSRFKDFKNLEVIKALQDKTPETAREALRHAEETIIKRFLGLPAEDLYGFGSYVGEIGGNEALHASVIDALKRADPSEETRRFFTAAGNTAFTRMEARLKRLKDDAQKEEFLGHLENGTLEHILVIREFEKGLAPEIRGTMLDIKAVALADFGRTLLHADTSTKRERLLQEAKRLPGTRTLDALEEVEKTLPENDREFLTELKRAVVKDTDVYPNSPRIFNETGNASGENGEEDRTWRARLEHTLKEAEHLQDQPELRAGAKESWYQSLLENARDAVKEPSNDAQTDRVHNAFSELGEGMYLLKNTALYPLMRERKTPGFLRVETQRKLALIFLDLKPRACGPFHSLVAIPLDCINGRWQRSPSGAREPAAAACRPSGCSGEICADDAGARNSTAEEGARATDEDVISACEFKPEYACYRKTRCERQPSGECGWTMTQETRACLERSQTAPSL